MIMDIPESGFTVSVINPDVILEHVRYQYAQGIGQVATDNRKFRRNINEFGWRS